MRRVVPTAQQRQLDALLDPKPQARPKRSGPMPAAGVRLHSEAVMLLPQPMSPEEWEAVAAPMQAKLLDSSKEDTK